MSTPTWVGPPEPDLPLPRGAAWLRVIWKVTALVVLVGSGLLLLLLLRLIERPLCGLNRPVTPHITVAVCRGALRIIGLRYRRDGVPMTGQGAMVANHCSWLDIFTLNAAVPMYFVSKAEVSAWPGIGWLARATGTIFISRNRAHAKAHAQLLEDRLHAGHRLVFFPEGTSTDGRQVIPFKTTLFAPFFTPALREDISVQPVSVIYRAPEGQTANFYGWWGEMGFFPHLIHCVTAPVQGSVLVMYHPPMKVVDYENRKAMAAAAEAQVRLGHTSHLH